MSAVGTLKIALGQVGYDFELEFSKGTGLELARGGFGYKSEDGRTWTTFDLISHETDSALRTKLYQLDRHKEYANQYTFDPTESDVVYLTWASDGEQLRRSPVYDLNYEVQSEENLTGMLGKNAAKVRLSVQHASYWEAATSVSSAGTITTLGGTMKLTMTEASYPGRIGTVRVDGYTDDEFGSPLTKFWAGIRDYREGLANFRPVWECEKGLMGTDTTAGSVSGASNGSAVTTTFATNINLVKRFSITWNNVIGSVSAYDHINGKYLILSRMKLVGTATEIATELRHGWIGFSGMESSIGVNYLSAVTDVNLVNYNLIPLGIVDIPPTGNRNRTATTEGFIPNYGLSIYAERLGTVGTAIWDCFILIPADHLFTAGSASIYKYGGRSLRAYTAEDDSSYAICAGLNGMSNIEYSFENWNMPVESLGYAELVVAAQNETAHSFGTIAVQADIIPRWRGYREP